jgi:hypothetical protein
MILLSACGGGGSADSNTPDYNPPPPVPTSSQIIANSKDYTSIELKDAAKKLADDRYIGAQGDADVNLALVQQIFGYLFTDFNIVIPIVADQNFTGQMESNGNIDIDFNCYAGGNAIYKGKVSDTFLGNISITYNNCNLIDNGYAITGSVAYTISQLSEDNVKLIYYFDELSWQINGLPIKMSGYSTITTQQGRNEDVQITNEQYVLFDYNNQLQPLLLDAVVELEPSNSSSVLQLSGALYMGDVGKADFILDQVSEIPPLNKNGTFSVSGRNSAVVEFEETIVRYIEDSDGDGNFDMGTFFTDALALLDVEIGSKMLTAIDDLSYPPIVEAPWLNYDDPFNTTTELKVRAGGYSDRDNALEDLQVSYKWYINGEVVNGQTNAILPAFMAVYGDNVKVAMVVSDGSNQVEGPSLNIELEDAPAQVETVNLPEGIRSGDVVQFQVKVTDPDVESVNASAKLISGPIGASINDDGIVSWNVPTEFLFPFQYFEFNFAITGADGVVSNTVTVPIDVSSNTPFPIVSAGLEVPKFNNSMEVGDFDGDGQNEILSTDSRNSVFLLESAQNRYKHKWFYPFRVPSPGQITQVLGVNIDDDAAQEILVVTENGASTINGLDSAATMLFSTKDFIKYAAVSDLDGDGTLELAYLYSETKVDFQPDYYLKVVPLDDPERILFSANLSNARSIELANVDQDLNLEIITSNGDVYDGVTWEKQWTGVPEFRDFLVTTGDYNGDGIAEIARNDSYGKIIVYSAIDKSELGYIGNRTFCSLHSADVDSDGVDELLSGNCNRGNVTSFKLTDNMLTKFWQVNTNGSSSVSLTTGDSDNDGKLELHWGTGVNNSGKDSLVSADIEGDTVDRRPESLPVQLATYSSAGWANVTDNQERAVFFIPRTDSSYRGSRIATVDDTGMFELSPEISSNWDQSSYAVTTDFNNDGFGDIFLPTTDLRDGQLSAMQLSNNSVYWQTIPDRNSTIGIIKAYDINGDGFDNAIYTDDAFNGGNAALIALDVENQVVIGSYEFSGLIKDFSVFEQNNEVGVLVSFNEKLSFLKQTGSVFSEQSLIEQDCEKLVSFNYDLDAQMELLCLQPTNDVVGFQQLVVYELESFSLTEVARFVINDSVIDVAADPSTNSQQNLFFTTETGLSDDYIEIYDGHYQIKKSNSQGNIIWSSPGLVGRPTQHGLKVRVTENQTMELMLSTNQMMYWVK